MRLRGRWLFLGLANLAAAILTYAVLVRTRPGQTLDAWVFGALLHVVAPPLSSATASLARPLLFYVLVPLVAVLALLALARGRWAAALAAAVVSTAPAPVSRHLREHVLTRPDLGVSGYDYNTFPSTHAAAAFGLLVAMLLVWPRPLDRADLSRVSFLAAVVFVGNVESYAHRPADILGSLLLVDAVASITVAILGFKPVTPRQRRAPQWTSPT